MVLSFCITITDPAAACASPRAAINYGVLNAFAKQIPNQNSDCVDVIAQVAAPFAGAFCSDAFDQARPTSAPVGRGRIYAPFAP